MLNCYYEVFLFLDSTDLQSVEAKINAILEIFTHNDTYTVMVNLFALLTFYQLLEDRYQKVYSKPFKKLNELEVIIKDLHNQIVKAERDKAIKEIEKKYKAKINELKRNWIYENYVRTNFLI